MRRYGVGLAIGVALGVAISMIGAVLFVGPLVLTHRDDLPLERAYGSFAVSVVSRLNSGTAQSTVPPGRQAVQSGRLAYMGSCAECHGANGDGKGVFGAATYPPATDLTNGDPKEMTDAQLAWIVKNGLSFTAMPAFGAQYNDQDMLSLVAYIRSLQSPTATPQAAITIPTPSVEQLGAADPMGSAVQRGAAVYFALGCAECHGATGNAPGDLRLRRGGGAVTEAVRSGRRGMPAYSFAILSDPGLRDLAAYLNTIGTSGPGSGEGGR